MDDLGYLFFSSDGRIGRRSWWFGVVSLLAIDIVNLLIFGGEGPLALFISVFLILSAVMVSIKRCHDRDKSAWWCLILAIPLIGTIWAVVELGILEGTKGVNRFGPDPTARLGGPPDAGAA